MLGFDRVLHERDSIAGNEVVTYFAKNISVLGHSATTTGLNSTNLTFQKFKTKNKVKVKHWSSSTFYKLLTTNKRANKMRYIYLAVKQNKKNVGLTHCFPIGVPGNP